MEEEKRVCVVCGKDISHRSLRAISCSTICYKRHHRKENFEHYRTLRYNLYRKDIEKSRKHRRDDRIKNIDAYKARAAKYRRDSPDKAAASTAKWRSRNEKRYKENANLKAKARSKKNAKELSDLYIKRCIIHNTFRGIEISSEMVEAKRTIILLKRQCKL